MKLLFVRIFNYAAVLLLSVLIIGCGGGGTTEPPPEFVGKYSKLKAYQSSKYSSYLKKCVGIFKSKDSCTMNDLPLIGQVTTNPTDKDILDRLIVSHKWMGDNFKQALSQMPNDMKLLFRSTTAVVIDEAIRPSYYWSATGAIYLDPANVWLTNNEKKDILKGDDYRSNFGKDLSFLEFHTYTKNGAKAFNTQGKIDNDIERNIGDIIYPLSALLFHELAHANDYSSIVYMQNFDKNDTIDEAIGKNWNAGNMISWKLHVQSPLNSSELYSLAKVRFRGVSPTEAEKQKLPDYVGALISNEGGVTHYNYSSYREDVAMLFEAGMMKYHYGIDKDQAFVSYPKDIEDPVCADYIVGAGSSNKISSALTRERMLSVFEYIFSGRNYHPLVQNWIGSETIKEAGKNWCETTYRSAGNGKSRSGPSSDTNMSIDLQELTKLPSHSYSRGAN